MNARSASSCRADGRSTGRVPSRVTQAGAAWRLGLAAASLALLFGCGSPAPSGVPGTAPAPAGDKTVATATTAAGQAAERPYKGPPNPVRGNAEAIAVGERVYAQHCATCHGEGSVKPEAEGPDLRRLDGFCRRLAQTDLKPRCLSDVDAYFLESVLEGKVRSGVVHMQPWRGVLSADEIWAIRSFVETRPLPERRTLPDLPPVR